jgi:sugar/nucleoside kinase (ribokinase family)
MYDVITFGAATRDVFVRSSAMELRDGEKSSGHIDACFHLGVKIDVDQLAFETGGGATNAAVTFGRLGFSTAVVSAVGNDANGQAIIEALRAEKIDAKFIQKVAGELTGFSLIMLAGSGERTVLVHRGASENISIRRVPWNSIAAKWFYVSSLGGDLRLLAKILAKAKRCGARVAWNPGGKELKKGLAVLRPLISKVDVFNLNAEEAMLLLGMSRKNLAAMGGALKGIPKMFAVITDGLNGSYAASGTEGWHSGVIDVPRVNVTGAGDAFGSGLVAGLMRKDDLRYALAVGTWNATGIVQQMGAKRGIMRLFPSPSAVKKVPMTAWRC